MSDKIQIITNGRQQELKEHGSYAFPVLVSQEAVSRFYTGSFLWHWHPEIELTLFTEGSMVYQINDRVYHPRAGQALFGNSNTMHTGRMADGRECRYISVTFHPRLLYGYQGSVIESRYTKPLTDSPALPSVFFDGSKDWHGEAAGLLQDIIRADLLRYDTYEMDLQITLCRFWKLLYLHFGRNPEPTDKAGQKNEERIRSMLSFIHENYQSGLTLDDISGHIHICKSECCRIFKGYMKESLFEYLLKYRIEKSIPYVLDANLTMTETALKSGFTDPNYFSKVFHRIKGCSPRTYRKDRMSPCALQSGFCSSDTVRAPW